MTFDRTTRRIGKLLGAYGDEVLRALVTNDDGIESDGLRVLALVAHRMGFEVIVAAPRTDASGCSASLQATQDEGRVVLEARPFDGLPGASYAVDATPGFLALLGSRGAFGKAPDVVLSGINLGANLGRAIIHSGTVGAAVTAGAQGIRGLAVSLVAGQTMPWATAAGVAERVLNRLLDLPAGTVINLNVPNTHVDGLRGIRQARLARFGAVETRITNATEGYLEISLVDTHAPLEDGTDAAVLSQGYASVTSLQNLSEAPVDLSDLADLPGPW
jgi:5'-nucleotidase